MRKPAWVEVTEDSEVAKPTSNKQQATRGKNHCGSPTSLGLLEKADKYISNNKRTRRRREVD
jgi:hypothetical protein